MRRRSSAIIIVGANTLLREGLARILIASDFHIAASAPDIGDIDIEAVERKHKSFLLIIERSGELDSAIRQVKELRSRIPSQRIVVLSSHYSMTDVTALYQAGANACLIQIESCDVLIKSIELVMLGETLLPLTVLPSETAREKLRDEKPVTAEIGQQDAAPSHPEVRPDRAGQDDSHQPQLSPCEQRILERLIEGDSNKAIARKVNVAEATVKSHLKSILRKIHVQNRTQAAIWAMNNLAEAGTALKKLLIPTSATEPSDVHASSLRHAASKSKPALRLASSISTNPQDFASPTLAGLDPAPPPTGKASMVSPQTNGHTKPGRDWYRLPVSPANCLQMKEVRTTAKGATVKRTSA